MSKPFPKSSSTMPSLKSKNLSMELFAKISKPDLAQKILFATADEENPPSLQAQKVFPGGCFRSEKAIHRRLVYLNSRAAEKTQPSLHNLLKSENSFAALTEEQVQNLEASKSDQAVYILTGQQPGLFGGPLLWFYKALTCATMAKHYSQKFSRPVLPIFWVAGDDSDLEECNQFDVLDLPINSASKIGEEIIPKRSLSFPDPQKHFPVSERPLDADNLEELLQSLQGIWDSDTLDTLRKFYSPSPSKDNASTLTTGFLHLAQYLLGPQGILFVDGNSKNIKALGRSVLESSILGWEKFQSFIQSGTDASKASGIPQQVELREGLVHAFAMIGGERQRLYAEKVKSGLKSSPQESFKIYTAENPHQNLLPKLDALTLSHDVFTRPLIADKIFPVLGHILGPGELRYFSQLAPLFLETTGGMPLLHPRMTASIAPKSISEEFEKLGFDFLSVMEKGPDWFRQELKQKFWKDFSGSKEFSAFEKVWLEGSKKALEDLSENLFSDTKDQGPRMAWEKALAKNWKKYLKQMQKRIFSQAKDQTENCFVYLKWMGNGLGQDRHLNFASLFNLFGLEGFQTFIKTFQ